MKTFILALVFFTITRSPAPAGDSTLPKVVLIGDSIRLGYAPLVVKKLEGKAIVVSPKQNGGDSSNVLKNLEQWVIKENPTVVHLNCGLHDLKFTPKTQKHQVELDQYEANLKTIAERIRAGTKAKLIFATTTPILDDRHAKRKAGFDRTEAEVLKYNAAALKVMKSLNVPVNDLHAVVVKGGPEKLLVKDGTHYTAEGSALLADAVADAVLKALSKAKK